jgi:hypothetical protein
LSIENWVLNIGHWIFLIRVIRGEVLPVFLAALATKRCAIADFRFPIRDWIVKSAIGNWQSAITSSSIP